ncbi:MAG: AAA family ATPase [Fusicatenibacter sp.]
MARTVAIGIQDFSDLIRKNYFYIDKTSFIKDTWDSIRTYSKLWFCISGEKSADRLTEEIRNLILPHVENHERILKAALLGDEELVVEAFRKDPPVDGKGLFAAEMEKKAEAFLKYGFIQQQPDFF